MSKILVTGAGGYIGSVGTYLFLQKGYEVIALDNLSRGFRKPLERLQEKFGSEKFRFYIGDIQTTISGILKKEPDISTVIHYAALCNVGESEKDPGLYFSNNISATAALLEAMKDAAIKRIVFSSTCSIYGEPQTDTISEDHPINPKAHPYCESKYMSERIIDWFDKVYNIKYIFLRYFNVCGASDDGEFGDSKKPSFHLMQNAIRAALGLDKFYLNNTEVDTPDKTPIRDYVNVEDLAEAHLKAIEYLETNNKSDIFNLGTGKGNSVLEIIEAVERITGTKLERAVGQRRRSDVSKAVASNEKINRVLGWQPKRSLEDSINTLIKWYKSHPQGWED